MLLGTKPWVSKLMGPFSDDVKKESSRYMLWRWFMSVLELLQNCELGCASVMWKTARRQFFPQLPMIMLKNEK